MRITLVVIRWISMFTKTTRSAIRMVTHLRMMGSPEPVSPRVLAEQLGESPTYLAKVARHLVKAGILRAHRGVAGGVVLGRNPQDITLLTIVEACQGTILGDFCEEADDLAKTCAFHQACAELHGAIMGVLSKWTLAQFIEQPRPIGMLGKQIPCWLESTLRVTVIELGLAPKRGCENAADSTDRAVPVPVLSRPRGDACGSERIDES
jgi:Rrf2 family protein